MSYHKEYMEVDVDQFSPFDGRLVRMVSRFGTDSVVDYISRGPAGVRMQRMKEGCIIDNPLATYELTWQQLEELTTVGKEYVQDDREQAYRLLISGENLRKLAELKR